MGMNLHTDTDLADLLGITVDDVRRATRVKGWPCIKPKRNVWRFTDAQVDQIVAMATKQPRVSTARTGQTSRSRRRSA